MKDLEFKLDTRLPVELFKKAPFIYTGSDFKSFPLGMISDILSYQGRRIERFYPLTVSQVTQNNISIDHLFCFSFLYINEKDDLILFLTHPCWLNESKNSEAFDFLFTNVEKIASFLNCNFIEVELQEITSTIAFPTSLSPFSYNLNMMQTRLADSIQLKLEFQEESTILSYEQNLSEIEKEVNEKYRKSDNYKINDINLTQFISFKEQKQNYPLKAYNISNKDSIFTQRNIPFFLDTISIACGDGDINGFFRWIPDLLEPFVKYYSPVPLLHYYVFEDYHFKCGKVIDWALKEEDKDLFLFLLFHVMRSMKQKGLEKCQIGFIDSNNFFVNSLLEEYNFRKIHEIKLMRKTVNNA